MDEAALQRETEEIAWVMRGGPLATIERTAIIYRLRACDGRLAHTARSLGISRTTLWRRLAQYRAQGLTVPSLAKP